MNEQTQMAFALGGEAETVDPVSGNDVPPGSLPVEVRDDIDAKLSEGEYVVPADVVRFFGVKFFEDLRMEAKIGLQQMDMDGRIGGEPIDDSTSPQMAEMSDKDIDDLIDAEMNKMNEGGMIGQQQPSKSMYSDPKKVDQVIAKISAAAKESPELSSMLSERGVTLPNTVATQTPEQMQDANRPDMSEKPKMGANRGGLMGYEIGGDVESFDPSVVPKSDFSLEDFDSSNYFEGLMTSGGSKIERIEVIGPGGGKMFLYWNSKIDLPNGYKLASSKKGTKETKKKDNSKSWIDKNPPKNIDVSKLSLPDLQLIQRDIERKKKTLFGLAGAFAPAIYKRAMKDIQDAVAGHAKFVNTLEDGALKSEGIQQLENFGKGVDVLTGEALGEMPGMFASLKSDVFGAVPRLGELTEEEKAEANLEDRITGIYTNESHLAGGPKVKVEESNFFKGLGESIRQSAIVSPVISSSGTTPLDAPKNVSTNGSSTIKGDPRPPSVRERTPGKTIAQQQQEAGGGNRADQQAIDTGFGSGDTGGKDDDYGTGQGSDLGGYGFLNKGGLIGKPKKKKNKSYKKGGYVTSKQSKQREKGLASRL